MKYNYSKWPSYSKREISLVSDVLGSRKVNYLVGKKGNILEEKFKNKMKLNYTCLVSNGTLGIELALMALNLTKNDEVIVTPRSYISSVSPVIKLGAKPIFADIDNNFNLSPESIRRKITKNTKAIICVHLYGYPCEMKEIINIKKEHNLYLIEDCSQAHGAKIDNNYVGSFGDIAIWSFCNDKIISSGGEGGIVSCKTKRLYDLIWSYKDIGKNFNKFKSKNSNNLFPYIHDNIGTNARMTEMQSVLALSHLSKLDKFLKFRNRNANIMNFYLKNISSIIIPFVPKNIQHAYYRYVITLNFRNIRKNFTIKKIIKIINSQDIYCNVGGCPEIYKEKIFKNYKKKINLKFAPYYKNKTLSFLVDQTISEKSMIIIAKKLSKIFSYITK